MKKLFIATVGTGQSGKDIAHAIYFSLCQHNPNTAVFIVSKETRENTLPYLEERIRTESQDLEYYCEEVQEINDFEILHKEYVIIIKKYIKQGYDRKNIIVDYTGGTKSMSAALVTAALATEVNYISYTFGLRGEGGRVKSGTERVSSLSTTLFDTEKRLNQAKILFNKNLFDASEEILSSYKDLPYPDFESEIKFIIELSRALNYWDKFEFRKAFDTLNKMKMDEEILKIAQSNSISINKLTDYTYLLSNSEDKTFLLHELLENAKRRASEGKYDDAVARLYRALEMLGQIEFEKEFKCLTSDVDCKNLPYEKRNEIKEKYLDWKDNKVKLPLYITFELLKIVNNKIGILFSEKIEEIKKILYLRNNSILAHGSQPLKKENFEETLEIIEKLLVDSKSKVKKFPRLK